MINTPKFWYKKNLLSKTISFLFTPFSILYRLGFLIDKKCTKKTQVKNTVISVGGINVGGSGKTPLTIELIKKLGVSGLRTFVVMRGYKSKVSDTTLLEQSSFNTLKNKSNIYGDEALILSNYSDIIIGKDKTKSIKFAEKIDLERIVIIDDGHQSHGINKDVNIIVINSMQGLGNNKLFPAGPLRESIESCIKSTDLVIVVKENDDDDFLKSKELDDIKNNVKTFTCTTSSNIKDENILAFCGIGFPWKFFNSLKKSNNQLIATKIFPDHYYYKDSDIDKLIRKADSMNATLVTTEKDIVKINEKYYNHIKVANLEITWDEFDEKFFKKICKIPT